MLKRLLDLFFERMDVYDLNGDGTVYLERWFLRKKADNVGPHWRIMVHHFLRGDVDLDMHDHPWKFWSFILWGGYEEETPYKTYEYPNTRGLSWVDIDGNWRWRKVIKPLSLIKRKAEWAHRVVLPPGKTAWTLVVTGPKERSWFFHTKNGLCPWRRYVSGDRCE